MVYPELIIKDDPQKAELMAPNLVQQYREAQSEVLIQQLAGRDNFHVLDMHQITMSAPISSAPDGMHYVDEVADASLTVLLNMIAAEPTIAAGSTKPCDECDNPL